MVMNFCLRNLDTMVGYKSRGVTHTFTEIYNTRTEELKEESKEDE